MKLDKNRAIIWKAILDYMEYYTDLDISRFDMEASTKTLDLFPSSPERIDGELVYCDEQANLFGMALFDCVLYYRTVLDIPDLEIDYELRKEFSLFPTLGDVFSYFEQLILGGKGRYV